MKNILLLTLTLIASMYVSAQAPKGYYDNADGKKKEALKAAMKGIIGRANVLAYGSGSGKTWTGFYSTDRYNGDQVRDRYSNETFHFPKGSSASSASAPNGMNIEHSFPKSWWGGTENQAYKDLFNLMPCESGINSSKSNYAMGVVTTAKTNNGCTKVGTGKAGSKNCSLWEPADKWKGDFARSYMYMVTSYSSFSWTGEALNMLEKNEWPTLQQWAYELLVQWSREDPVDQIEIDRNEAVYKIQGNRNPFIDFPNLCEYIWGDSINYVFSVNGTQTGLGGDDTDTNTFMAYEASEIVSSIYSRRFDANWSRCRDATDYQLDVYTKDEADNKTSHTGFPVWTEDCSYTVKDVKASTTYYYQVSAYNNGVLLATTNEVRVDFPAIQAAFSVTPEIASVVTVPGEPSQPVKCKLTLVASAENYAVAMADAPFEMARTADAEDWVSQLTLHDEEEFYVRLSVQPEGDYDGYVTISTKGENDITIHMLGIVDALKSFFEDFETGTKGAYAVADVTCTAAKWRLSDALIGADTNCNGLKSLRLRGSGYAEMLTNKHKGCGTLLFYGGNYNSDSGTTLSISYSNDGGETWHQIVSGLAFSGWSQCSYPVNVAGDIRLKLEGGGAAGKRVNIDDVQMTDYSAENAIDEMQTSPMKQSVIYDLTGRRASAGRGIFVVDGKKFVR